MKYRDKLKAFLREHPPGDYRKMHCKRCNKVVKHDLCGSCWFADGTIWLWGNCLNCRTENYIDKKPKRPGRPEPGQKVLAA